MIIHYPRKGTYHIVYLCNKTYTVNPDKISAMKGEVTCKNCLRKLKEKDKK